MFDLAAVHRLMLDAIRMVFGGFYDRGGRYQERTFLGGIMATADLFPIDVWCCFSLSPLMDRRRACIRAMGVSKLVNFGKADDAPG